MDTKTPETKVPETKPTETKTTVVSTPKQQSTSAPKTSVDFKKEQTQQTTSVVKSSPKNNTISFKLDDESFKMYNVIFQKTKNENKKMSDDDIHQMIFMDMFYKLVMDK